MFKSARLKLTAWYLLIIMVISVSFSVGVYKLLTNEVDRFARAQKIRLERKFAEPAFGGPPRFQEFQFVDPELIKEVKTRMAVVLGVIDLMIFVVSGLLAYFLAGRTLKPIKEMVDEQNRFIADASHEIRTPLTALKSSMEVFLRDPKSSMKDAKNLIEDSIKDVDLLSGLSTSLLQLAQYQKSNNDVKFHSVNLTEIIYDCVKKIEKTKNPLGVKIFSKIDGASTEIMGNETSLSDLFINLIENAVKYGKPNGKVNVSIKYLDKCVEVVVKDNGIGISKEDLPRIFDRFYRADSSRSKNKVTGYGLGLSIVKNAVDEHRGTINIDSVLGKGTAIKVVLPYKRP